MATTKSTSTEPNTPTGASIDELVEERIHLASLQVRIPVTAVTVLPNGKQILFLAPANNKRKGHLSLQFMNLDENNTDNDNDKKPAQKWEEACDFTSVANLSTELSLEQKLLRERQRMGSHGITSYTYHAETNKILFQYGPHLVIGQVPEVINSPNSVGVHKIGDPSKDAIGTRMDAKLTSDGAFIVFARNDDLWITTSQPNLLKTSDNNPNEIQLTFSQNIDASITSGVADFINEEEFDRYTGYWISPNYNDVNKNDLKYREYTILYLEADSRKVPTITIPSMDGIEQHKWPRSGETNCLFKVKIVKISVLLSSVVVGDNNEIDNINKNNVIINCYRLKQSIYSSYKWIEYIVRAGWTARNNECWLQYLDRKQMTTNVVLYQFDKHFELIDNNNDDDDDNKVDDNLCGQQLLYTSGSPWINVTDSYKFIQEGLIWCSEHTGYKHLYFIPYGNEDDKIVHNDDDDENKINDATKVNMKFVTPSSVKVQPLTSGSWSIESEKFWFNKKTNTIYFNGRKETHLEKQFYSVQFDPNKPQKENALKKLTNSGCWNDTNIDFINFKYFISVYSSISRPREFAVYSLNDRKIITKFIIPYRGQEPDKLKFVEPKIVQIENYPSNASDDDKKNKEYKNLHTFSALIYPPYDEEYLKTKKHRKGGYPTIIYVYGGPHVQLITNSWDRVTGNSKCQLWRTLGYTVAVIDGRGSYNRGLAFEGRLKYKMGCVEVQDQVQLVEYLVKSSLTDPKRVAITGYSYGGYMTLLAMSQRPDVFKVGLAGAPVTKWELYDTGYTERYMGTPQNQKEAYQHGSVLKNIKSFPDEENRLVIIHGLADENVHFYHTSKLINALVQNNKPYVLKIFPGERHGVRKYQNIVYLEKFYIQHLQKYLK